MPDDPDLMNLARISKINKLPIPISHHKENIITVEDRGITRSYHGYQSV